MSSVTTVYISVGQLKDHVEAFLHAAGFLRDKDNVKNIDFGMLTKSKKGEDLIPVSFQITREQPKAAPEEEGQVFKFINGKKSKRL